MNYTENQKKQYELLSGFPQYGNERIFSVDGQAPYSEGTLVRFCPENGEPWIANFKKSESGAVSFFQIARDNLLIVVDMTAYKVNLKNPEKIECLKQGVAGVIQAKNRYILYGHVDISVLEDDQELWSTARISWDGLKDIVINGPILSGHAYDPTNTNQEWSPFTLNLQTRELTGGTFNGNGS